MNFTKTLQAMLVIGFFVSWNAFIVDSKSISAEIEKLYDSAGEQTLKEDLSKADTFYKDVFKILIFTIKNFFPNNVISKELCIYLNQVETNETKQDFIENLDEASKGYLVIGFMLNVLFCYYIMRQVKRAYK
ncbi:unnamed protein product [Clavelina lepadiformis]|uniref:Uncharacterized protein n=1 Tax=Clavelina lepadiformis TaxID=159417 RepID=A0ABP0FXG1_CLALP